LNSDVVDLISTESTQLTPIPVWRMLSAHTFAYRLLFMLVISF